MSEYIRRKVPGSVVSLTIVTHQRCRIFTSEEPVSLLRQAFAAVKKIHPFRIIAFALLEEHVHLLMRLPAGDDRYGLRVSSIKQNFTRSFLASGGKEGTSTRSQRDEGRRAVWQRRFHEHTIRDLADLRHQAAYTLFNPVKHGLVERPVDWPWSSLHRDIRRGRRRPTFGCARADALRYASRVPPERRDTPT